jgi:hypothetical protein
MRAPPRTATRHWPAARAGPCSPSCCCRSASDDRRWGRARPHPAGQTQAARPGLLHVVHRSAVRAQGSLTWPLHHHHPPEAAVVLCVDEKSGMQAQDRSQPVLPRSPSRPPVPRREHRQVFGRRSPEVLPTQPPRNPGRSNARPRKTLSWDTPRAAADPFPSAASSTASSRWLTRPAHRRPAAALPR